MNIQLLNKYNKQGPRYTSYPPATFFHKNFGISDYKNEIVESNNQTPHDISLYVHIPFCNNLCYFCGCNTEKKQEEVFIKKYIEALLKEIDAVAALLDKNRKVIQIHWGGGTPNSISLDHVQEVMETFAKHFTFSDSIEVAMECNPAFLDFDDIVRLKTIGFNRISLGVQDFDPKVLHIVNRSLPKHPIEEFVKVIRNTGFKGVNIDLIYGLPGQTAASFEKAVEQAIAISPDRLVTFSYAHVPWVKSAQQVLEKSGLPSSEEKLDMFYNAYKKLTANNYKSIGMDHYAKVNDSLSKALKNKMLHRNFQGYCTKETTGQVYAFGASAISQLQGAYVQNIKNATAYIQAINNNDFAVERGYKLNKTEQIRRRVINELMCNGYLNFNDMAKEFNCSADEVKNICEYHPQKMEKFVNDDLMVLNKNELRLKEAGFFVVRNIAMELDPALTSQNAQYSKTL